MKIAVHWAVRRCLLAMCAAGVGVAVSEMIGARHPLGQGERLIAGMLLMLLVLALNATEDER